MFHGTEDDGYQTALLDADQHVIRQILHWKGDPMKRTTMEFQVEFEDGDILWIPYSKDLDDSVQYGTFIEAHSFLFPLRFKANLVPKQINLIRKKPIISVKPDDVVYVELRCAFGLDWYDTLDIPGKYDTLYVVIVQYVKWRDRTHRHLQPKVLVLDEVMRDWDAYDVFSFASNKVLSEGVTLIDEAFVVRYPDIIDPKNRDRLLKLYS